MPTNGYLISVRHISEQGDESTTWCWQDVEDERQSKMGLIEVIYEVLGHVGLAGSRHDPERIVVRLEPGDKWEGPVPADRPPAEDE